MTGRRDTGVLRRRPGSAIRTAHKLFCLLLFDPLDLWYRLRGLPQFLRNLVQYRKAAGPEALKIELGEITPCLADRFKSAGSAKGHYFWQDLEVARLIFDRGVRNHVDVGSRVDGFIAHLLPFCSVTYVDIRPLNIEARNLKSVSGSLLGLPFDSGSVQSLSCLHVIEHVGLGRYGDPVDPGGHIKAAAELVRVLAPGGTLVLSTPVGRERVCFDAHRVFSPATIVRLFGELELKQFGLIDDRGEGLQWGASLDDANACGYGCGVFILKKPGDHVIRSPST